MSRLQLPSNYCAAQEILTKELLTITTDMLPSCRIDMLGIPLIQNVRILRPSDEVRQHYKRKRNEKKIYRRGETEETKHKYSKIFYDPFAADKNQNQPRPVVEWVEGETGSVMVDVVNNLLVEINIQNIQVVVQNIPYEAFSQSFVLAPLSRRTLKPNASILLDVFYSRVTLVLPGTKLFFFLFFFFFFFFFFFS